MDKNWVENEFTYGSAISQEGDNQCRIENIKANIKERRKRIKDLNALLTDALLEKSLDKTDAQRLKNLQKKIERYNKEIKKQQEILNERTSTCKNLTKKLTPNPFRSHGGRKKTLNTRKRRNPKKKRKNKK